MASRLIALGVRNGDSFYLERERRSVLVDGGQSQRGLCRLFKGFTGARYVDYLVCPHAEYGVQYTNSAVKFFLS